VSKDYTFGLPEPVDYEDPDRPLLPTVSYWDVRIQRSISNGFDYTECIEVARTDWEFHSNNPIDRAILELVWESL
jgi:hypothetical protein